MSDNYNLPFSGIHPSLGALQEQFDIRLSSGSFVIGNGCLSSVYIHNGRNILLKFPYKNITCRTVLNRNLFKKILNKYEVLVSVSIYENGETVESEELDKVIASCPKNEENQSLTQANSNSRQPRGLSSSKKTSSPPIARPHVESASPKTTIKAMGKECKESISVKFSDLIYEEGSISFQMKCAVSQKTLIGFVYNPAIRREFKYITRYFCNVFSKEKATVNLVLKKNYNEFGEHYKTEIVSASSKEIDQINSDLIVEIQKDYCIDTLFTNHDEPKLENVSDLFDDLAIDPKLQTATSLVALIAERKPTSKHILQLKYLANQHIADKMPLKRGEGPRSLLFLIQGTSKLYLVLETINSKLATYIWECPDNEENIQIRIKEVEEFIATTSTKKRRNYRNTKPLGFYFIEHKYQNLEEDFIVWLREFTEICS